MSARFERGAPRGGDRAALERPPRACASAGSAGCRAAQARREAAPGTSRRRSAGSRPRPSSASCRRRAASRRATLPPFSSYAASSENTTSSAVNGCAVGEGDVRAELQRVAQAVGRRRPALGQPRLDVVGDPVDANEPGLREEATRSVVASRDVSRLNDCGLGAERTRSRSPPRVAPGAIPLPAPPPEGLPPPQAAQAPRRRRRGQWPQPQAGREVGARSTVKICLVGQKTGHSDFACNSAVPLANLRAIGEVDYKSEIRRPNGWPTSGCRALRFAELMLLQNYGTTTTYCFVPGKPPTAPLLAHALPFVRPHNRRISMAIGRTNFSNRRSCASYRPQRVPGPRGGDPRRLPADHLQPDSRRPSSNRADPRGLAAGADRLGRRRPARPVRRGRAAATVES